MQAEPLRSRSGAVVAGPVLLTPRVFGDDRGFFYESWNARSFQAALTQAGWSDAEAAAIVFRQDNHSRSTRGVLRGLHYQLEPEPQGKLVRCSVGAVFDVAVDLRRSSPTFGQWVGAHLSEENHQQLWVPVGFGHGFLSLSEVAEVQYKASGFWNRSCERSLRWDDPDLAIAWPLEALGSEQARAEPILAEKDAAAPSLAEALAAGEVFA
ncbi:dTDP-4-dehydrorhamnose 3,5-epimerase [Synechococcus sp. RSCCF101]|uniref:dTDP-4-dehydrorhamnose 3,5-epimerase n=1 Tax=Synechococcus sp. RSCCF101 TaxID=2511069 RepID=UPI0012483FE7|nr:dTDP-4-dehydrorhamnose 3,5-epimerase [Synechococcus sp. RSCCF101]QEY32415.1 dTDP-4-dehydrorhamnose 3,5-epimerase [Synechococcus sp. RSCCF101]